MAASLVEERVPVIGRPALESGLWDSLFFFYPSTSHMLLQAKEGKNSETLKKTANTPISLRIVSFRKMLLSSEII